MEWRLNGLNQVSHGAINMVGDTDILLQASQKLNLTSDTETAANLIMDSTQGGKIPGQLNKVVFSETLYPSDSNIYKKHVRQRTSFNNDFWVKDRGQRRIIVSFKRFSRKKTSRRSKKSWKQGYKNRKSMRFSLKISINEGKEMN